MKALLDTATGLLPGATLTPVSDHSTRASEAFRAAVNGSGTTLFAKRSFDLQVANRELAAIRLLNEIESPIPLAPKLLAFDPESKTMLLEDLGEGEGPNTGELLMGNYGESALTALLEHARLLALLHGKTCGNWDRYQELRGPAERPQPFREPWPDNNGDPVSEDELAECADAYAQTLATLGIRAEPGSRDEIIAVGRQTEGLPTDRWAFCKGDQNMAGDYVRHRGLPRLMDFGAGGLRPAFSEGMPERMTWGCMMAFPESVALQIAAAYREELAIHAPHLANDPGAPAEAAARWHVYHTLERLPRALVGDFQRGPTRLRQQVVAWLRAFAEGGWEGTYPALSGGARNTLLALQSRWEEPDFHLPHWPAFA